MELQDKVFVIGHKNPDTDSICAAISLAWLKNAAGNCNTYEACRAGQINEETEYVLKYWNQEPPRYLPNAGTQVCDMEIEDSEGAPADVTLHIAWDYMKESEMVTLPVMDDEGKLEGLLSVVDIANYYIDAYAYAKTIMADAKTKYYDIAETISGAVVVGNEHSRFIRGKIVIAASDPEHLHDYIETDDLVITSNREDAQLEAIRCGAGCLVVTLVRDVSDAVRKLADEKSCIVICTAYDTYAVARLINQSIPVRFLMKKDGLVTFRTDDYVDDIREVMGKHRYREFPILDHSGHYIGMISRRSLLNVKRKKLILVDHTEKSQAADNLDEAEILEIIDHHRIGTVETLQPVYFRGEPVGCTCTILASMYEEQGIEIPPHIAGMMCAAIISDTLLFRSPTCTPRDERTCRHLAEIAGIELEKFAGEMFRAGSNLRGKSPEEILHQDYKKFIFGDIVFGVGQISSMDSEELQAIADTLKPYLAEECGKGGTLMIFFMLTNILTEDTLLLSYGEGSDELVMSAFGVMPEDGNVILPRVVSRKKQLIPAFMTALQEN
ncbi:MAG: putative manganese-dependent inorganic diphosphatase [Lachnospiraceae bacterium]|nr:putative manganese-dependent inorganic diphosphatase [Lachnospiraceae bacterium]